MYKITFLTEMGFEGKISVSHKNMRTEFAWMYALNAVHNNIHDYENISGYDFVFVIFPKGRVFLSTEGSKLIDGVNPVSDLLKSDFIHKLKDNNSNVFYVQEGPHWWWTNYDIQDQILFYNMISECDAIFAHNEVDMNYYRGLFKNKKVYKMPSLMIEETVKHISPKQENKVIVGGNFSRWYGGFESYLVASKFKLPIWTQTSHAMRENEEFLDNLNHLPRLNWTDWMGALSEFKYAVHLMPTIAAGTFNLNCAYFGIPCVGNKNVDTQRICFPELSVDISDVHSANVLIDKLINDQEFYYECSKNARENYLKYFSLSSFNKYLDNILESFEGK